MTKLTPVAGPPLLCAAGLAGMAYCHIKDVGAKFDEHVYYMAALFCCNIAASLALIPLVLLADRLATRPRVGIWATAGTLAALTVAGFLWSRTFGLPQMADHIGAWDALGLASIAFEALVIAVSIRVILRLTSAGGDRVVLATPHRTPLWASAASLLGAVATLIALHHAPALVSARGCASGAAACHATATPSALKTASAETPDRTRSSIKTYTYYRGPIATGDFATHWVEQKARHPHVNGFVIGMHARLVDTATGQPTSIASAMLHHLFFTRVHTRGHHTACGASSTEIFYSTGEEDETFKLPPGYGYRLHANDRWRLAAMIMSHALAAGKVTIEYTVTIDHDPHLIPVHPFWLRANGCRGDLAYTVAGGGRPGSRDLRTFAWHVPFSGRIVAASGHLHGGAVRMSLTQPRCRDRKLLDTNPRYGMPGDLMYDLHPVLHEPAPMDTRMFISRAGIGVRRGETLDVKAAYDDRHPHWAVMAVMHVYLARAHIIARGCRNVPRVRRELVKPGPARSAPPVVHIPLARVGARGVSHAIHGTLGSARRRLSDVLITVDSSGFSIPHLSVPRGATVTWRFPEPIAHDVTFASGPRAMGALATERGGRVTVRFRVPGRYKFFCSLHPMTMHEVIDVGRP